MAKSLLVVPLQAIVFNDNRNSWMKRELIVMQICRINKQNKKQTNSGNKNKNSVTSLPETYVTPQKRTTSNRLCTVIQYSSRIQADEQLALSFFHTCSYFPDVSAQTTTTVCRKNYGSLKDWGGHDGTPYEIFSPSSSPCFTPNKQQVFRF